MGRAPCCSKIGLNRGPWTPEEDNLLSKYIESHGEGNWRALPKAAGLLRCGKSCRLRWVNYLRPNVKRGNISEDEEDLIVMLHALLGNRWSLIAARMPGRTDNEIKNYWNTHLSKKLASKGLDPKTHKPIVKSTNVSNDSSKNKSVEGPSSSESSSSFKQSVEEDDDPQEAWETTMDLDTCSYSTGSYAPVVKQKLHKGLRQNTGVKKKQMPNKETLNVKVPLKGSSSSSSLFACASPSSVLNFYSPSASTSSEMANSHSSSCLSQHSEPEQECFPMDGMESCWEELSNNDTFLFDASLNQSSQPQADAEKMLQFIDDFLCNSKESETNLNASNEFWDAMGRIEPATSLWDGLGDITSVAETTTMTTSDELLQQTSVSQGCGFQDSISELLFAM